MKTASIGPSLPATGSATVSLAQAAVLLGVSEKILRKEVNDKEIAFVRYNKGGRIRFRPADLEVYIAQHRTPSNAERFGR